MLCELLSESPQHVWPLPCNVCVSVTSEHRQGDGVTLSPVSYTHLTLPTIYSV